MDDQVNTDELNDEEGQEQEEPKNIFVQAYLMYWGSWYRVLRYGWSDLWIISAHILVLESAYRVGMYVLTGDPRPPTPFYLIGLEWDAPRIAYTMIPFRAWLVALLLFAFIPMIWGWFKADIQQKDWERGIAIWTFGFLWLIFLSHTQFWERW